MIYLLDANVLIALVDSHHQHHGAAIRFFSAARRVGWATCPLVENAFIRIFGHPRYPNGPGSVEIARQILHLYCASPGHQFLPDNLTLCDLGRFPSLPGSLALTDHYLIALAVENRAQLATFDSKIDATLIPGGPQAYHLISSN